MAFKNSIPWYNSRNSTNNHQQNILHRTISQMTTFIFFFPSSHYYFYIIVHTPTINFYVPFLISIHSISQSTVYPQDPHAIFFTFTLTQLSSNFTFSPTSSTAKFIFFTQFNLLHLTHFIHIFILLVI
jgi:hypothetical protein